MTRDERISELDAESVCPTPLRVFDGNVWGPVQLRKGFECAKCDQPLFSGSEAYKPLGGPGFKSRRVCFNCATWCHKIEAILPLYRDRGEPKALRARVLKAVHQYLDLLAAAKKG